MKKYHAALAQLVERYIGNVKVPGSIPGGGFKDLYVKVEHLCSNFLYIQKSENFRVKCE